MGKLSIRNYYFIRPETLLIAFFLIFVARANNAQCFDESKLNTAVCSAFECKKRQALVHKTCDVPRTCKFGGTQADLKVFRDRNLACVRVRKAVGQCYKMPDKHHDEQIETAQNLLEGCRSQITP